MKVKKLSKKVQRINRKKFLDSLLNFNKEFFENVCRNIERKNKGINA